MTSARTARRFVTEALTAWDPEGAGDGGTAHEDAALLATELVTNALRHGSGPFALTLTLSDGCLRIAVEDHAMDGTPIRQAADPEATGGRGLALVELLADSWGVTRRGRSGSKTVWCELSLAR
jgi:anti-sigma regulatory factor (Ser/Thr protein kinase)